MGRDKVSFKQADWEGAADGAGVLSSQQVLNFTWMGTFGNLRKRMTFHVIEEAELSRKKNSCRIKQILAGDSPFILSLKNKNLMLSKFSNKYRNIEDITMNLHTPSLLQNLSTFANIVSSISSQEYFSFLLYLK